MVRVVVTLKGWAEAHAYLERVKKTLRKPDPSKPVNAVGKMWQQNYKTEGGMVGGWAQLAQITIANRRQQGYGAGPIMIRNSGLYRTSSDFFATRKRGGSRSITTPYGGKTKATATATLTFSTETAVLTISGPQVYNQWPGIRNARPARPFWFTTQPVRNAARGAVVDWILKDVL